jgi:hypothetical protein
MPMVGALRVFCLSRRPVSLALVLARPVVASAEAFVKSSPARAGAASAGSK